jgi:predicted PurR-regulated permease PerM
MPISDATPTAVFTRERVLTFVLAILTLLALYVCYLIVEPFIPPVAFALALAVATRGPYRWLKARLRKETVTAAVAVLLAAILIIGPAAFLTTYMVQTAVDNIGELQRGGGVATLRQHLEQQPYIGPLVREATARFRLDEQLGNLGRALAGRATGILSGSIGVLAQLGITLFILFFLYRDRGEALQALRKLLPLSNDEADRLFDRVGSTIAATVNGSLTVALVQALLAGAVYMILGVPGAVLWGAVTFITALVPVLGTFLVWAPIALYLALTGSLVKALFLVIWGALVVGSVDNLLYPYLVGDKLRLHTVPTFFSVLGGIALFGPSGLILGPMALAVTIALIDVWWQRLQHGEAAEEAIADKAEEPARPGSVLQERGV